MSILEIENINQIVINRTTECTEPIDPYLDIANKLEATQIPENISRAEFIRMQCNGFTGEEVFKEHHESWGIPTFQDDLVGFSDFKRGFLFTFRDHAKVWKDSAKAWNWFLISPEARFVRRYEVWIWNSFFEECIKVKKGSYKEILTSLIDEDGFFEALISPVFTKEDLDNYKKSKKQSYLLYTIKK